MLPLLALLLCLQDPAPKPTKPESRPAAKAAPHKDDALTAKDPAVKALDKFIAEKRVSPKRADWKSALPAPALQKFDPQREYHWHWLTNKGEVTIRLRPDVAPMHVTSVIYLTRRGFYDGLTFHRVIQKFMAQGGCPRGDGNGNPGYQIEGECSDKARHDKAGILSTANEGRPKTDGSQFFVTFGPTPALDGKHTVFGEVTAGMDTVQAIESCGAMADPGTPSEKLVLERAWITVSEKKKP